VEYLGHKVVPSDKAPMTVKVEAIVKMLPSTNVPESKAVLGTANYYRKFVKDYSTIAAPLNNLLREDVAWNWSEKCQKAFDTIKERLTQAPILRRLMFIFIFIFYDGLIIAVLLNFIRIGVGLG
jgi:hypothetical protein